MAFGRVGPRCVLRGAGGKAAALLLVLGASALRDPEDALRGSRAWRNLDAKPIVEEAPDWSPALAANDSWSLVQSKTRTCVDPAFLVTAVGLSTLANIANVVLHSIRISEMEKTLGGLNAVQDRIFQERADECFAVRSLEVQADLLTRAMEAFARYAGAQVPSTMQTWQITDGKLAKVVSPTSDIEVAITSRVQSLAGPLREVGLELRRAMAAAVQSACHSAASGEILLQADIVKLEKKIKEAQQDLVAASANLVATVAASVLKVGAEYQAYEVKPEVGEAVTKGTGMLAKAKAEMDKRDPPHVGVAPRPGSSQRSRDSFDLGLAPVGKPKVVLDGIFSSGTGKMALQAMDICWKVTTTLVYALLHSPIALALLMHMVGLAEGLYKLIMDPGKVEDVAIVLLDIVINAIKVVHDSLAMTGVAIPGLGYVTITLSTILSMLKLAKTSLQLHREKGEHAQMLMRAQATEIEAKLTRSFGTCSALGVAWGLAGTANGFIGKMAEEVAALPDGGQGTSSTAVLGAVYGEYARERPAVAALVLREAFARGVPGVTAEVIQTAEALTRVAPITDFAVAKDSKQAAALGAIGFKPAPTFRYSKARFLLCRGCGDSVVVGMALVEDAEVHRSMQDDFNARPSKFGSMELPPDATLNFVQLPKEERFQLIAFVKVPLASLATFRLPVLMDMREELFMIEEEESSIRDVTVNEFERNALALMEQGEVEVIGWNSEARKFSFGQKLNNGISFQGQGLAHIWVKEFGRLDVLTGRFWTPPTPSSAQAVTNLESLVPAQTLKPLKYVTVTAGCGCTMGIMGNRYRTGAGNVVLLRSLDDDDIRQKQGARCRWRFDLWLSDTPIPHETVTQSAGSSAGLGCGVVSSGAMTVEVADPADLDTVARFGYQEVRPPPTGYTTVLDSDSMTPGSAGPVWIIGEDGETTTKYKFQIVYKAPTALVPGPTLHEAPREAALRPLISDFRGKVASVLCSNRCAFQDASTVHRAIGRITGLNVGAVESKFKPINRGATCKKQFNNFLIGEPYAEFSIDDIGTALGPLSVVKTPEEGLQAGQRMRIRVENIYDDDCDFQAQVVIKPPPCDGKMVSDLRVTSLDEVHFYCRAPGGAPPVSQMVVTWSFDNHPDNALLAEEAASEQALLADGFIPWGRTVTYRDDGWAKKSFKEMWYKCRTLRQRIFVQLDPRIGTARGADVCSG